MLTSILAFTLPLQSQSPAPGGIPHPSLWYSSTVSPGGKIQWQNRLSGQVMDRQDAREDQQINFNPAFTFDRDQPGIEIPLPNVKLQKWTLFTVYQPRDTFTEKSIWSYSREGITEGILTTHRMADFHEYEYLNFPGGPNRYPKINTYLHHQSAEEQLASGPVSLLLGQVPRDRALPISPFTGPIPEIILYERVLAPVERQRVTSYLAIKYGTSLAPEQQVEYLDASERVIFAPAESGEFTHRITGIGRDDLSGLEQQRSSSSYSPGQLIIGFDKSAAVHAADLPEIPDQHFLIWADNDQAFHRAEKRILQPAGLQRKWLVQAGGHWKHLPTELQFDTHYLHDPAKSGETYWLRINRSGSIHAGEKGLFDYYPMDRLEASGIAHFREVYWDTDGSGRDRFTIVAGPELLVQAQVDQPLCHPNKNGGLRLKAIGGRSPYEFQLSQGNRLLEKWTESEAVFSDQRELPVGHYNLLLRDADGREYRENFFFQSSDAPVISLDHTYQVRTDEPLHLDAGLPGNEVLQYQWEGPDGTLTYNPILEVRQPGTYLLTIERSGCIAQHSIAVEPAPTGNFRRVSLFPNPSSDGRFRARIYLEKAADLELEIYTTDGRQLVQRRLSGSDYYHTGAQLHGKGSYLIRFRSDSDQITIPFIVQ